MTGTSFLGAGTEPLAERLVWLERSSNAGLPPAKLACRVVAGDVPNATGVIFLHGFGSDQRGSKAEALARSCSANGRGFVRFDMSGHGESGGEFTACTISDWRADALVVLDTITEGPQVLVGSSMGAWIALLAAQARPDRVAGVVLIAPAPDFTETLMWNAFGPDIRAELQAAGVWSRPSAYSPEPQQISLALIEDGRRWLLLGGEPLRLSARVRILHGDQDPDVPWQHGLRLFEHIVGDARFTLIKGGDHRLSSPDALALLCLVTEDLCRTCDPPTA